MPSRAFLLFGLVVGDADREDGFAGFQCPRGHFCFSDKFVAAAGAAVAGLVSMPSRAFLLFGHIFSCLKGQGGRYTFQCPRGHFCFSDPSVVMSTLSPSFHRFNALAGIFAFRTPSPEEEIPF